MPTQRLCALNELPAPGELREFNPGGHSVCVANEEGRWFAISNVCPHQGGPLAEGTLEHGRVLCPWHAWAFDVRSGREEDRPDCAVQVYALEQAGEWMLIDLPQQEGN